MGIKGSEIVQRIDEHRTALGLSRKELALSSGLKPGQSITDWEKKESIPKLIPLFILLRCWVFRYHGCLQWKKRVATALRSRALLPPSAILIHGIKMRWLALSNED